MRPLPSLSPSGTGARDVGGKLATLEKGYGVVEVGAVAAAAVAYVRLAHIRRGLSDSMLVRCKPLVVAVSKTVQCKRRKQA